MDEALLCPNPLYRRELTWPGEGEDERSLFARRRPGLRRRS
jgi:hypothetical protein